MKRILFAINNKTAEQKLSKLIKEYDPDETYQVVGTLVSNESITDFLANKHTDILVYIEGLSGKEDGFDYILRLHRQHPNIRIVFIAGQRSIGDKKLATLVAFHIYDIIAGQRILMTEVAERIVRPAQFEDVMMYLPDSVDLFHDNDFAGRNNHIYNAQDDSERVAEKASLLKQLKTAEEDNHKLNIQLSAAEAQVRDMEAEKAEWREELSRERMVMEKSFEAEKKTLNATIIELNEKLEHLALDKEAADKLHLDLKQKYEAQSKTLSLQQSQSSINIKNLQTEIRSLKAQIEDKEKEVVDIRSELEALKQMLEKEKEALLGEAQAQADELLASANKRIEEASRLTKELKEKIALYGDDGFAAYKEKEMAKMEQAQEELKQRMDAEYADHIAKMEKETSDAEHAKLAKINELNITIEEKEKLLQATDSRVKEAEAEVRKAKNAEIERMDAAVEAKRKELYAEQAKLDAEVQAHRALLEKEDREAEEAIRIKQEQAQIQIEQANQAAKEQRSAEYTAHRAQITKEINEHAVSFENRKQQEQEQIDNMHKTAQEKIDAEYAQHRLRIEKELTDAQLEKIERINALNDTIAEKEDEIRMANTRIKEIEVDVRKAKQAEVERIDAEVAAKKQEIHTIQEQINADYAEHRERIEKELAEAQAVQTTKIKELDVVIHEKENLISAAQEKIKLTEAEVKKAKKAEIDKVNAFLAETEAAAHANQEKIRQEYAEHRAKVERELVDAQKVQLDRIAELDSVIAEKYQIIRSVDRQIEMAENEVREAKQAEIEHMNAIVEEKRKEFEVEKNNLAKNIADLRSQKMAEVASLDADIAARQQSVRHLEMDIQDRKHSINLLDTRIADVQAEYAEERKRLENDYADKRVKAEEKLQADMEASRQVAMAKNQEALAEHKDKINSEMDEVNKAFAAEKRRLSKDFEAYRKEMIEKRAEVEMEYGTTYTFNEHDFITGPSLTNKCQSVMVYSPIPGTGNSTLALNLATILAMNHKKVIYIELNSQHPTLKEHLGISIMKDSLDTAFQALRMKSFDGIEQNIITKQRILNLKTSAFDMQTRYPDMLSYMSYTEGQTLTQPIDINFLQGLVAYLKYKKHYEYVIFDVPSYFDKKFINDIYNLCNKHIVSTNQDILSLNNLINMKDYIQNLNALERTCYMVNKYMDNNTVLSNRKIAEICKIKVPGVIPLLHNDAILSSYKSIPMILITQSKDLVASYKSMVDYIVR